MERKVIRSVGAVLLCLVMVCTNSAVFAEEKEVFHAYEGLFPPSTRNSVSLLAVSNKENIKADIKVALMERKANVDLRKYEIPADDINELYNLFYDVLYENPELFYVKTAIGASYNSRIVVALNFSNSYAYTDEKTINQNRTLIDEEVNKILDSVDPDMSDAEKALVVHDWFVLHYAYDTPASLEGEPTVAHRIDGLFIDKKAVCQGYALGYIYVLEKLGIESIYVPSNALGHAWNMVKIEDAWYHVDVTWDDPTEDGGDLPGNVSHENFLLSDADLIASGHKVGDGMQNSNAIWDSPYTASKTYEGFWRDINGAIGYKNNVWYYMRGDSIYNYSEETETLILINQGKWYTDETKQTYYADKFFNIGVFKDKIYYNTADEIRCVQFDGSNDTVFWKPEVGSKSIYGMFIKDDMVYCVLSSHPYGAKTVSEGMYLGFDFTAKKKENTIIIHTGGHVLSGSNFYVAVYNGKEMLRLDVIPIVTGTTKYTVPLQNAEQANKVKVYAFSGVLPKDAAVTIPLAS